MHWPRLLGHHRHWLLWHTSHLWFLHHEIKWLLLLLLLKWHLHIIHWHLRFLHKLLRHLSLIYLSHVLYHIHVVCLVWLLNHLIINWWALILSLLLLYVIWIIRLLRQGCWFLLSTGHSSIYFFINLGTEALKLLIHTRYEVRLFLRFILIIIIRFMLHQACSHVKQIWLWFRLNLDFWFQFRLWFSLS